MKLLFVDCSAGAAGDMLLAALVDAGASEELVRASLESLPVDGWGLGFEETRKGGIRALKAVVDAPEATTHRTHREIVSILESARLEPRIRARALHVFSVLARAEAKVHGIDRDQVHFHEVGALDAIVDIVGCSAALESLNVDRVVVSPIATGTGTARGAHGELPLPAPAVTEILRDTGATLYARGERELITPTGAALLASAADDFDQLPPMSVEAVGYGAGGADLGFPNVVRVLTGNAARTDVPQPSEALLIETNIDDMSPELFPYVIQKLIEEGAQDAWVTPVVMKKGRPAFTLSVLCAPDIEPKMADVLFRETTTLGTRTTPASKRALQRKWMETQVGGCTVRVKLGIVDGVVTTAAPEHDDAVTAAGATGLPLKEVYARAVEQARAERVR